MFYSGVTLRKLDFRIYSMIHRRKQFNLQSFATSRVLLCDATDMIIKNLVKNAIGSSWVRNIERIPGVTVI